MTSVDIGDRIIAAVAQEPFVSGGNWFCTLIPICNLEGEVLSDDAFPNRGLIWWRVIEPVREYAEPRNLIIVQLETAPAYDQSDRSKDYYQVGSVSPLKSLVSEIITLNEHRDSDALIRAGTVHLDRPVVGSVYFRTGEDVSGPWKLTGESAKGVRRADLIKPVQNERVWRWKWDEFEKLVRVIHRDVRIVVDWRWSQYDSESYTLVFQEELKRAFEHAQFCDALSDRDVIAKVARATVTHVERREIERFFEQAIVTSETVDELQSHRPRMEKILRDARLFEEELEPILTAVLRREELKPALQRRQEVLAQEYVAQRREELDAQVHRELRHLVNERKKLEEEIRRTREAFEKDRRRQEAQLQKEREQHIAEIEEQRKKIEEREQEAVQILEKATQRFSEQRGEVLQNLVELLPLLNEIGLVPSSRASNGNDTAVDSKRRKREFELPAFVTRGVQAPQVKEHDFLDRWIQQCREGGYSYSESDLLNFHVAMKSERFNILAGPSGIGKSTLPRLYSQALHGSVDDSRAPDRFLLIPVRPGWMDTRDLLGYFNSLEGFFQPSPSRLFQYLVYAHEEEEHGHPGLYIINLDEINLSYVEHYFADFLSALQSPEGQQGIQCFYPELCREDDPFRKYGYLPIAQSVRFVGTANMDETTKPFSPRLLDRMNVVELQISTYPGAAGFGTGPVSRSSAATNNFHPIAAATYRSWTVYPPPDDVRAFVRRVIEPIQKVLAQYGYPISPRVMGAMVRYIGNARDILSDKEAMDRQILQRVLPKLRGHTERFRRMLEELATQMPEEEFPRSARRLARMAESEYAMDFFHCLQDS